MGLCPPGARSQLLSDRARLASVQLPGTTGAPINLLTLFFRVQAAAAGAAASAERFGEIEWLHLLDPEVTGGAMDAAGMTEAFEDLLAASAHEAKHARRKVRPLGGNTGEPKKKRMKKIILN